VGRRFGKAFVLLVSPETGLVNVTRVRRALEPLIYRQFRFLHPLWYHTNPRGDSQWEESSK
jgi:hypothetical protein